MASTQTFHDHILELRRRLLLVILAIGISGVIAYIVRVQVIRYLQRPLGATLFYTSPAGSFNFVMELSMIIGVFVALPIFIYQLIRFIEPALPIRIKRLSMLKIIGSSFGLALIGIAFAYLYMIPLSLHFFSGFSTAQIKPLINASEYLSYVISNLLIFALIFQIPLLVLFINWIKPIKPSKILHYQRHVIVGAFGLAVILPFTYDPMSQFIVAVPIILLYYTAVILLWATNRRKVSRKRKQHVQAIAPIPSTRLSAPIAGIADKPATDSPASVVVAPVTPKPITASVRPQQRAPLIDGVIKRSQPSIHSREITITKRPTPRVSLPQRAPVQLALANKSAPLDGIIRPFQLTQAEPNLVD